MVSDSNYLVITIPNFTVSSPWLSYIGLVEVVWKVVTVILNWCLTASIAYHKFLHEFRADRVTGITTATLEAKILQQLSNTREEVLWMIFMDLHKVYNAL